MDVNGISTHLGLFLGLLYVSLNIFLVVVS